MSDPTPSFAPPDPGAVLPAASPVYVAEPRRRRWLPWVIVIGVLLIIGLCVAAFSALVSGVIAARGPVGAPLVTGDTGFPLVDQLECAEPCFTVDDIEQTVIADSGFGALGMTEHAFPWGTYDATTADELFRAMVASWKANDGTPDACVFALGNSPSVVDLVSDAGKTDPIEFTGEHATADITSTLDQSVRVFPDTASAADHMARLYDQIEGCPEITIGSPTERYSAQITPAPGLSMPSDVAVVGWVRTGDPGPRWRAYVFDMQRGNLVVRTRMLTDGSISEQQFRAFVEEYALQLAAIEPAPPAG